MKITAIKTRKFLPPKDNLDDLLNYALEHVAENSILVVTSKVISICEGRCVDPQTTTKDELVQQESQMYLPREFTPRGKRIHAITSGVLIGSAGIDQSNGDGYFILWPEDPKSSANQIRQQLLSRTKIKNLGVIITDSNATPFHRGAVGTSIAYAGFEPLNDYRGSQDLFGRDFIFEQANIPDSLAAGAVLVMGEGSEQTPMAIITDLPQVQFCDHPSEHQRPYSTFEVPFEEDMFYPFFASAPWQKGSKH